MITCHSDGLCLYNPGGIATWGFIIRDSKNSPIVISKSGYIGKGKGMNNVVAEYTGILKLIEELNSLNPKGESIIIKTDYMIVAKQINGEWNAKEKTPMEFLEKISPLLENLRKNNEVTITWIPREENKEADKLTLKEYHEHKNDDFFR